MPIVDRLAKAALMASFEPEKEFFRVRPGHSGAITRTIRSLDHDQSARFASPKGRDAFLLAAYRHLRGLDHEELLIAFGTRRGSRRDSGAALRRVHRAVGQREEVGITSFARGLIDVAAEEDGAEVVLVHNHPPNPLKTIIHMAVGWLPLASDQDRNLALSLLDLRREHILSARRPSSFKWYLVDQDRMAEFYLPSFDAVASALR